MATYLFTVLLLETSDLQYYPVAVKAESQEQAFELISISTKIPSKKREIKPVKQIRGIGNPRFYGKQVIKVYPKRVAVVTLSVN
jgi:hypothetical protein